MRFPITVVLVALFSAVGCGDLAARREVKIGQMIETGETRIGKPFEIRSRLPNDWGEVRIVQRRGRAGPVTTVEIPPGHDVRILLVPAATTTADALPEPPEMERRDIMGPSPDVQFVMPKIQAAYPGLSDEFLHRGDKQE